MIASGSDISAPAPMPCTARKAASMSIEVDIDDRTAPRMKTTMPKMYSGRRPKMSESLP
jgi:hypothetical protein